MDQADYRRLQAFIEPCLTIEDLDEYIQKYFGIELPWDIVDENSTSSSLQFMWEVNHSLLTNSGINRHVLAASRNSAKTLTSSIIQFIALIHYRRSGLHLAASLDQAGALIKYIDKFLKNPLLAPYTNTDNVRAKILTNLPPNDFTCVTDASLVVATATKKGTNSQRSSILTFDEVDLTPREILSEAAFIADPSRVIRPNGKIEQFDPVFIYLSSRKTNDGPIQDLIDEAEATLDEDDIDPIKLHRWAAVDWMEKCSPEQHRPEEGEIMGYVHTETLETVWGEDRFEHVPVSTQAQYEPYKAFQGCRKCPAWVACLGRSVDQGGLSPMLRTRKFVGQVVKAVKDPAQIIAQALNWKPESTGLVFKNFSANHHIKDPRFFYEWVTFGKSFDPLFLGDGEIERRVTYGNFKELQEITPTKEQTYEAMIENDWTVCSGIDWGFSDPAVCIVIGYHKKTDMVAVLHIEHAYGYANHVWAEHCSKTIFNRFPIDFVAPDQADPSSVTYFAKYGIRSLQRKDKPKKIATGISKIRGCLWDASANESHFSILDDGADERCNIFLIEEFKKYSHARDAIGRIQFDKYEDNNNHGHDSLRYALHPFTKAKNIKSLSTQFAKKDTNRDLVAGAARNDAESIALIKQKEEAITQMKDHMMREHGLENIFSPPKEPEAPGKKRPGGQSGIKFSIGD